MSGTRATATTATNGDEVLHARFLNALSWLWLGLSAAWAVVIFATDQLAWPLALWIATTVGPLTALKARLDSKTGRQGAEHPPTPIRTPSKGTKQ